MKAPLNMIRKIVLLLVLAAACPHVMAAVFSGVVVDEGGEPLAGASLRSAECNVAAVTDINGGRTAPSASPATPAR